MQVLFLYNGRFLSLPQRLTGLNTAHDDPNMARELSYEYLNQQLVWGELQNFVMFLLPLMTPRTLATLPWLSWMASSYSTLRSSNRMLSARVMELHDLFCLRDRTS